MKKDDRIYIAGHRGLVGSSIMRRLEREGYSNLITATSGQVDLRDQASVETFFRDSQPQFVFLVAAKVGGIKANNTHPAEFLYDNLMIEANVIHASYRNTVEKLLFLGSTCIYPRNAPQPLKEEYLLTGPLEPTNEWYAIAKIAGIKLCQAYRKQHGCNFISAMPTNLYGPSDNFDLETSHVLPALLRKFHEAKERDRRVVTLWGSGAPRREFLYVDDCADACLFLMQNYCSEEFINVGMGKDISIRELAEIVAHTVGYQGDMEFDTSMPDGTPRKLVCVDRLHTLGWSASVPLREGVKLTYEWYKRSDAYAASASS